MNGLRVHGFVHIVLVLESDWRPIWVVGRGLLGLKIRHGIQNESCHSEFADAYGSLWGKVLRQGVLGLKKRVLGL